MNPKKEVSSKTGADVPNWELDFNFHVQFLIDATKLIHYRPAMPFRNRKTFFRGSFQFIIVTIKKISPLWKPEI